MQPTLNASVDSSNEDGDQIYIRNNGKFDVGDIVVANVPWWNEAIIKRCVAGPNDTIQIKENVITNKYDLLINGNTLYSRDITESPVHRFAGTGTQGYFELYQAYLIRNCNGDDKITLKDDEYFLMGDNWGETTDSLTSGPVKASNIVGKVDLIIPKTENKLVYMSNFIVQKLLSIIQENFNKLIK